MVAVAAARAAAGRVVAALPPTMAEADKTAARLALSAPRKQQRQFNGLRKLRHNPRPIGVAVVIAAMAADKAVAAGTEMHNKPHLRLRLP